MSFISKESQGNWFSVFLLRNGLKFLFVVIAQDWYSGATGSIAISKGEKDILELV